MDGGRGYFAYWTLFQIGDCEKAGAQVFNVLPHQ